MRVRGAAPGGEAASLMSRQRRRSVLRSNPCRAERLRLVWKGAGDRDAGWRTDLAGDMCRAAKAMRTGTCVHAWRSARVVSDLQDVKKSRGYGGYDMMHRLCHCQPATALTVVMALHRHPFNPALVIVARSPKDVKRRLRPAVLAVRPAAPGAYGHAGFRVSCRPDAR